MEKVRAHGKNEMHDQYFTVLKEKLDEIVEFLGLLPVVPPPLDENVDKDEQEPYGD